MKKTLSISLAFLVLNAAPAAAGSPKEITNTLGMKLVRIDAGEFLMGSVAEPPRDRKTWQTRDWDESPAHKVKISKAFYLGAFEVTNAQYQQFDPHLVPDRAKLGILTKGD